MTTLPYTQGETLWNEYATYISNTASSIARSYWTVEEEDVKQEIWAWLWEKEADLMAKNCSPAYIKTCIKNVARNYALKVRDTTLVQTDKFYYSFDEVKELLPTLFGLYESWAMVPVPDGCATQTGNDGLEIMLDFVVAYGKLSQGQQDILRRRYGNDEELSEAKDRQQASRALKKLVLTLNAQTDIRAKDHTGPGSRKAMTNAAGIYQSQVAVEG